jgi:histidine kinase
MVKPIILCVDDEKTVLNSLRQELEYNLGNKYLLELAESAEEGLEIIRELTSAGYDIHVVISDQLMPGMKGDEFLIRINREYPEIRKILLTGQANADAVGNAVNHANLYRYIAKPWDEKDLRLTVEEAAKSFTLNKQLATQVKVLSDLNRNAEMLSEQVTPAGLSDQFLLSCLADSGAKRGLLYLPSEQGEQILYATRGASPEKVVTEHISREVAAALIPWILIETALQDIQPLVLHNVAELGDFTDAVTNLAVKPRSVYANALLKGETKLGVLYLDEPDTLRFFTTDKVDFLNLLCSHAATCLENAWLYQNMENRVVERTKVITEKNKQITNSIEYARRIQLSILPPLDLLHGWFPDSFVMYHPKDIVSGDFFWFADTPDGPMIAAVDCTGHGVPGAFMSVLGNNFLNQTVKEHGIRQTDKILDQLHQSVREALKQYDEQATIQDGMDIAICRVSNDRKLLQFSGAKRPMLQLRGDEVYELKPNRHPIGGSIYLVGADEDFLQETLDLQPGDRLYLTTDGFADQFGGELGRKYSNKRFTELLLETRHKTMAEQGRIIEEASATWRGTRHQTDDILVIGFQI